ncbi:GNAT family N-acetyltransferase [Fulvivirga lutea]|uniref:N-acetyltransferase n=1 Tax=Fulvivirga lutea TaxID=2810512 RepID=A0A974WHJ8_9BACT|nr:N-acetyltransferase [Fulvivirga lutea]QSE98669.1 N-acetyltransferase [Fulvivirga lutea]
MDIKIRQEKSLDYDQVEHTIKNAFKEEKHSDQTEHLLVGRLRKSTHFIPELSIVAEKDGKVIGHILLSKVTIENERKIFNSLGLAPVSVLPVYQKQGIGSKLIIAAHNKALQLGYDSVVLLGHEDYYTRFGYKLSKNFGIKFPFKAPEENCFVLELKKDSLKEVSGTVKYPMEFF